MATKSKSTTNGQNNVDSMVLMGTLTVVNKNNTRVWSGTMTELQAALVKTLGKKNSAALPGSPGALRVVLNRVVNRLRTRGISVRFTRTSDHARTRVVRFTR